jgi:trehalose-phosphatase
MATVSEARIRVLNIPDFWPRLRTSKNRFLALDYDGTLAPFKVDRMEAYPAPGIADAIIALAMKGNTSLAIISGRPVSEVLTFLGEIPITFIGGHGFEVRRPNGEMVIKSPSPRQLRGLDAAEEAGRKRGYSSNLEPKVAGLSLHTRGMSNEEALRAEKEIFSKWRQLAIIHELSCQRFDGGFEIYSTDWNKGSILSELLEKEPRESFSVYVGDDETDENAFQRLHGFGIGIKVGAPEGPTAAAGFLPDFNAVRTFLETWLSVEAATKN